MRLFCIGSGFVSGSRRNARAVARFQPKLCPIPQPVRAIFAFSAVRRVHEEDLVHHGFVGVEDAGHAASFVRIRETPAASTASEATGATAS
jgi:hypothetical protein